MSYSGPHSAVSHCPPNEYQCGGTELCIHMSKLCNGVPDCTDGWDEGPHCRGITVTHILIIRGHMHVCSFEPRQVEVNNNVLVHAVCVKERGVGDIL